MVSNQEQSLSKMRISYLDSLRGLAVILMVQQHLQSWLWKLKWLSFPVAWEKYPYMLTLYFTGWFSAPLFIIISGVSAAIMEESDRVTSVYVKRGIIIIICGYILNLITPNWFSPGSWYVLHTIGLSITLAPALMRLKSFSLIAIGAFIIILPALLQTMLNTPLLPGNSNMNNISLPGGIARLAVAEGHFPIFPWLSFFIAGIVCRRMVKQNKTNLILYASIITAGTGIFLAFLYHNGFYFATGGVLFRLFVPLEYFYPPLPPFILFLMGTSSLIFYIFSISNPFSNTKLYKPLNELGRSSLFWFMIHVFIFNQIAWIFGFYKAFDAIPTLVIILLSIFIMCYVSTKFKNLIKNKN